MEETDRFGGMLFIDRIMGDTDEVSILEPPQVWAFFAYVYDPWFPLIFLFYFGRSRRKLI